MELIIGAVVLYVAYVFLKALSRGAGNHGESRSTRNSSGNSRAGNRERERDRGKQRTIEENEPWLRDRWRLAKAEQESGALKLFPQWYFEDPTDRQRARLEADGINISAGASKGQYSDYIGLFVDPEPHELEMLKFFNIQLNGSMRNQTRVRHEIALIEADQEKQRAWLGRPANNVQKEFYRFIGEKPPKGLTYEQAEAKMRTSQDTMEESQLDEWSAFENMLEEFEDSDFRSDLEIRKPSPGDIRAAMATLKSEGKDAEDPYAIAEKLLAMKPELKRGRST